MGGPSNRRAQNEKKNEEDDMAPKIYQIATKPDTIIVLTRRLTNFAVWPAAKAPKSVKQEPEPTEPEPTQSPARTRKTWASMFVGARKQQTSTQDDGTTALTSSTHTAAASAAMTDSQQVTSGTAPSATACRTNSEVDGQSSPCNDADEGVTGLGFNNKSSESPEDPVHYHVSSQHLISASTYFRNMLSGEKWEEGVRKGDGRFYLTAEDIDERALETLLSIIHLRNRQVSRRYDLDTLAKVAMLVDYYECCEAVEVISTIWCPQTAADLAKVPQTICRELMLWLCVSYTFRLSELFEHVTTIALKESKMRALPTLDLPIANVLGKSADDDCISHLLTKCSKHR